MKLQTSIVGIELTVNDNGFTFSLIQNGFGFIRTRKSQAIRSFKILKM